MTDLSMNSTLDLARIQADFPILDQQLPNGQRLVYMDSAATAQKPDRVIQALDGYYRRYNANVHRGIHTLAEEATAEYEGARAKVAQFINAASVKEIIFVRNTTEGINLVAQSWGRANLQAGDVIVVTEMEHHSNLVPWHQLAAVTGAVIEAVPVRDDGLLDLEAYGRLLALRPKLVAVTHMSNVLGTINPVEAMISQAHAVGAVVLVDGAQSVPHFAVDVQALDADFYAFSGHKLYGPTGIGVLYGKRVLLEAMPPWMGGGDMIRRVYLKRFDAADLPYKFEAGTPNIAGAIGLGAAIDYVQSVGLGAMQAYEEHLASYLLSRLAEVPGLRVIGPAASQRGALAAFFMPEAHAHDVAQVLDGYGLAVRAGHHCAMPLHDRFGLSATTRASLALYNTTDEIDQLIAALYKVKEMFG